MASLSQGVVDYGDGLLFRPDQPLPLYAADKLAKAKAADKEQSKKERRETRGS
jgi:hypothetical protein